MNSENKFIESPCNVVLALAQKFILPRILIDFAKLHLGKLLKNGPLKLSDIATSLEVDPQALRRFLRLLTAHHIITNIDDDMFASTPMSDNLDTILNAHLEDDYRGIDKAIDHLITDKKLLSDKFVKQLCDCLNKYLKQPMSQRGADILAIAHEFVLAKVIMCAAELKLGNLLDSELPLTLETISSELNISPDILQLIMRILVMHEIVEEVSPNVFKSTALSKCLDRILSPHILDGYKAFNGALHTLQKNTGSWEHVFGKNFYDYLNQHKEKLEMFKQWCIQSAIDWLPPILSLCSFPDAKKIVDVGGGGGYFIASVLQKNPHMQGVLFDQPSIIEGADNNPIFEGLRNRVSFVGGDFFKTIPKDGDIYTICRTLLNWDDEKSIEIINNCHAAMNKNGKLWIIDFLVPDVNHPKYPRAVINDISLFVIVNSAIRTEEEWRNLIDRTHFTVSNIFITNDDIKPEPYYPMCVIEAIPK